MTDSERLAGTHLHRLLDRRRADLEPTKDRQNTVINKAIFINDKLVAIINRHSGLNLRMIVKLTGLKKDTVSSQLSKLAKDRKIRRILGQKGYFYLGVNHD